MRRMRSVGPAAVLVFGTSLFVANAEPEYRRTFAVSYCAGCHDGEEPEGSFRTGETDIAVSGSEWREQWLRAGEYVAKGVMPPVGARQPSADERERFFETVLAEFGEPDAGARSARPPDD